MNKMASETMKDNRGFTLIELIVVMLIIAILAVGSMAGYNLLNAGSAKHAAERIEAALSSVQMDNMTKNQSYTMEIKKDATGDYILSIYYMSSGIRKNDQTETLDLKRGNVTFESIDTSGVTATVTVTTTNLLEVNFLTDTGGVALNTNNVKVTRIGVTSAGSTCYIRLVTATGKHFIE